MRVAVFGLGYVGCVSSACLADLGHSVIGVDKQEQKVAQINSGQSTIVEDGISEMVRRVVDAGLLSATVDSAEAVRDADVIIIAVGTPTREDNSGVELQFIERASFEIGEGLRGRQGVPLIMNRSTVPPGTTWSVVRAQLEAGSGKRAGEGFRLCFNPEFLREGSSIKDFQEPPFTIIGLAEEADSDLEIIQDLYGKCLGTLKMVEMPAAELFKYLCNVFHALKVVFGNEVGRLAQALSLDGVELMDAFCLDTKLNISKAYLTPGFAFGGSCLPKDIKGLLGVGRSLDVELPLVESLMVSNEVHLNRGLQMILDKNVSRLGMIGIGFKSGTDDLRDSPFLQLAKRLKDRGIEVRVWDPNVRAAQLIGANQQFVRSEAPWLESCMEEDLAHLCASNPLIVLNSWRESWGDLQGLLQSAGLPRVIDLSGALRGWAEAGEQVEGICW